LTLPIATVDGNGLSFLDALFTSTSATCVTGLIVVDTGTTFTKFGQIVIIPLIQIGGLWFMTFVSFFRYFIGKRISLRERLVLQESLNNFSIEGVVRLAKRILIFTAVIETIGESSCPFASPRICQQGKQSTMDFSMQYQILIMQDLN